MSVVKRQFFFYIRTLNENEESYIILIQIKKMPTALFPFTFY